MDISTLEDFLTYSLDLMIMIIIVFITFDLILFLNCLGARLPRDGGSLAREPRAGSHRSWKQVSLTKTDFYQQVKDAIWDKSDLVTSRQIVSYNHTT